MKIIKEVNTDVFIHYDSFAAFHIEHDNKQYIAEQYCAGSENEYIGIIIYDLDTMKYASINKTFFPDYVKLIMNGKWQDIDITNNQKIIEYYKKVLYEN